MRDLLLLCCSCLGLIGCSADTSSGHASELATPEARPQREAAVAEEGVAEEGVAEEGVAPLATKMKRLPAGNYRSMFPGKDEEPTVAVTAFFLDEHAVTNEQFLRFVRANPKWRRSAAKRLFVDPGYLGHWAEDLSLGEGLADRPVTNVSWFAARAYARWVGKRLPTLAEWEYVAAASKTAADGTKDKSYNQRILDWYGNRSSDGPAPVRSTFENYHGVHDMHGLVWEWVEDFNTALVTGESRGDTGLERTLFCGAGSIGSANPEDYASFMRFAFRSSLTARYTVKRLGFRCAADRPKR